jgi:hypothetical protein
MAAYFPFTPDNVLKRPNIKVLSQLCSASWLTSSHFQTENTFQDLNVIFCELTSLLDMASLPRPNGSHLTKSQSSVVALQAAISAQSKQVSMYVVHLLKGGAGDSQLARPLTPTAYLSMLPTIWSFLNAPPTRECDDSVNILQVIVEHAMTLSSHSALKKPTTEFLAHVVLVRVQLCFCESVLTAGFSAWDTARIWRPLQGLQKRGWYWWLDKPAAKDVMGTGIPKLVFDWGDQKISHFFIRLDDFCSWSYAFCYDYSNTRHVLCTLRFVTSILFSSSTNSPSISYTVHSIYPVPLSPLFRYRSS